MNQEISFVCKNGLGDKLLDVIGVYIICKYLSYELIIDFNKDTMYFAWGNNNYDERLFIFDYFGLSNGSFDYFIESINPSASLCPYNVYLFLLEHIPTITLEEIINFYKETVSTIIKPSSVIESRIPLGISNAYGLHLRKTDKINNNGQFSHENTDIEFDIIIEKLLESVDEIAITEKDPTLLIVTEDIDWKRTITDKIKKKHPQIIFLEPDYENHENYNNLNSVLDMFCLSKCKHIIQGVKYSTFSILSALIGKNKLTNFSEHLLHNNDCLIHNWSIVLNTNIIVDMEKTIRISGYANKIRHNLPNK